MPGVKALQLELQGGDTEHSSIPRKCEIFLGGAMRGAHTQDPPRPTCRSTRHAGSDSLTWAVTQTLDGVLDVATGASHGHLGRVSDPITRTPSGGTPDMLRLRQEDVAINPDIDQP